MSGAQAAEEYSAVGKSDLGARKDPVLTVAVDSPLGSGVASARVTVSALIHDGASEDIFFQPVGTGITGSEGSAAVSLNRDEISRHSKDDEVELRVTASDPNSDAAASYTMPVRITEDGRMVVNGDGQEDSLSNTAGVGQEVVLNDLRLSVDVAAPSREAFAEDNETYEAPTTAPDAKLPRRKCKFGETEQLRFSGYSSKKWLNVNRLETAGRSSVSFSWSRSHSTKWSIVSNAKFAGYSASQRQSTDTGVVFSSGPNKDRFAELEWTYRRYDIMCYEPLWGAVTADSGRNEWRPREWTGGSRYRGASGTGFTCKAANRTTMAGKTWVTRDTTATYTSSLQSLSGVALKQQQTTGSKTKVTVTPSSGKTPKICGSNNTPLKAKQIKEVP